MRVSYIIEKIEPFAKETASELGFEFIDMEYVKEGTDIILRIFIDKQGGINIDDCQEYSKEIGKLLDEKDIIEEKYLLEVSSPGLTRAFKREADFERNIGKDVEIKLYSAMNGKKELIGSLLNFNEDNIKIEEDELKTIEIDRKLIAKINLAVRF